MDWCPFCGDGQIERINEEIWKCNNCEIELVECSECQGQGFIDTRYEYKEDEDINSEDHTYEIDCPECHGLGLMEED